jgi:preprotein translocase subunit SecA
MRAATLPIPGPLWGRYPERRARSQPQLEVGRRRPRSPASGARLRRFAERVAALDLRTASEGGLDARLAGLRARLAREALAEAALLELLAIAGELAERTLGLRPHPVQYFAARAMLDGGLAEMATGEGKTVAAALAAAAAALARVPVHVITVNDYLAQRDGEALRPFYERLGLSAGIVTQQAGFEARRTAYACDVAYCTSKELVFDYLRDLLERGPDAGGLRERMSGAAAGVRLRGLCLAVIDEADSVLLDEARVPFILSRPRDEAAARAHYERALALAATLRDADYVLDPAARAARLTASGQAKTDAAPGEALWQVRRYREEAVTLALAALHLFRRDRDYLVRGGEVLVIEATTGRVAPGRVWSRGLQQLIELKERLAPSRALESALQITYQSFFARYVRLCGMSGTLAEGRGELERVYGLPVVRVPLRSPSAQRELPTRVFAHAGERWAFVARRAREVSAAGRPVLIGTDSVADSHALSELLAAAGLAHSLLDARNDRAEAQVVALAGAPGRITVATSMAGRGTDIALGPRVAQRGGLHVILCQANASPRIDRQFLGRCARRGEPGSCEALHSAETERLRGWLPAPLRAWLGAEGELRPRWLARALVRFALRQARRREERERLALWRQDKQMQEQAIPGA